MGHIMYRGVLWCFVGSMSFVYSCGIVIIIMYLYYNVRKGAGASKKEPEGLLLASIDQNELLSLGSMSLEQKLMDHGDFKVLKMC